MNKRSQRKTFSGFPSLSHFVTTHRGIIALFANSSEKLSSFSVLFGSHTFFFFNILFWTFQSFHSGKYVCDKIMNQFSESEEVFKNKCIENHGKRVSPKHTRIEWWITWYLGFLVWIAIVNARLYVNIKDCWFFIGCMISWLG